MKAIYKDSTIVEREAKLKYSIPEYIMMENAAAAMHNLIDEITAQMGLFGDAKILLVCGSGNNGGDGYALARRLHSLYKVSVIKVAEPRTFEAMQNWQKHGFSTRLIELSTPTVHDFNLITYSSFNN